MSTMTPEAQREKKWVASTSVAAAVGLTGFKLVIGLTTGSLGILAEAAHSSLDLAAAIMTLVAVCVAARPADRDHLYGHGKVETVSYTHLRAHETRHEIVCRLLLEKTKN